MLVGTAPGCDLVLTDPGVAPRHAYLRVNLDGRVRLQDLGSDGGTWVDGGRIDKPVELSGSGEIRFGPVIGTLSSIPPTTPPPPTVPPPPGVAPAPAPVAPRPRGGRTLGIVVLAVLLVAGGTVAAIVASGGGTELEEGATTPTTAVAPVLDRVTAKAVSGGRVRLEWSIRGGEPTAVKISRGSTLIGSVDPGTAIYDDLGVVPNHDYTYTIEVFDAEGRTVTATSNVKTPPPPPLGSARIQGHWTIVKVFVSENYTNYDEGDRLREIWSLRPQCSKGPCAVKVDMDLPGQSSIVLAKDAADYSGKGSALTGRCGTHEIRTTFTIALHVSAARFAGGVWQATKLTGSFREYASPSFNCQSGSGELNLTGTLRS